MMGPVWVRRGEVDREALRKALEILERGEVLGVAPEGTRARGPYALQKGKVGAAYLATRADVPIVPLGITGTENIKRDLPRLRRAYVRVVVGQPFRLPESGRVRSQKLHEYTDLIMYRIAELLPEEYRGVYA
jgi:1-acyl-sn-glycerol-3-phosphate acyltransferase